MFSFSFLFENWSFSFFFFFFFPLCFVFCGLCSLTCWLVLIFFLFLHCKIVSCVT